MVICLVGGLSPHHENEFDVVLSVTGHDRTKINVSCDFVAWMEFGWM